MNLDNAVKMNIKTKFSPNDRVVLNKNNRQAGIVRFVNVTAGNDVQIVSYDVVFGERIYQIRESELIKIKDND